MSDDDGILSVDQITSLMRLYLDWPELVEQTGDAEAEQFYEWLGNELDDVVLVTGGLNGVKQFLKDNLDVVYAGRNLKKMEAQNANNCHAIPCPSVSQAPVAVDVTPFATTTGSLCATHEQCYEGYRAHGWILVQSLLAVTPP